MRLAVRTFLSGYWGLSSTDVVLHAGPGQVPRVEGANSIGLSFSHAPGLSLAAIHLDGPIGVDLQADEVPDDWRRVAQEFLDPLAVIRLEQTQGLGFAAEWAALEAGLKLRGQPLQERSAREAAENAGLGASPIVGAWRRVPLDLPTGWAGCVAFP